MPQLLTINVKITKPQTQNFQYRDRSPLNGTIELFRSSAAALESERVGINV
ncbi:hypothetical protein ACCS54_32190 [Rhizobium johnstonii]|jgi:hypothetical protein|uniref:hypothetical protein n=1 Tax=Rhizobium TaxID=379 RepID=UPI000B26E7A5|nr:MULTISPECIES: hypothetical protein [Rhizobium]MDV4165962.1 hypothetical protein [Rhizobium leguminosarum]MDV4176514.1 hypothetical protein [Rhizobium leguminosarum]QIO56071.1 hypothetical protein HA461_33360 [Rhizobium leguminosarum bv. trifolii]QIO70381.1 hypothetical protein HA462_35535 [Rhizobium leguminosarum bv. trifolii]QIO77380.1 hypothetical protein HA459_36160 [Rhizobium leguminosarum bv. trifolii]